MDYKQMTPQERYAYKSAWLPHAHTVRIHSDLLTSASGYCKQQLAQHEWKMYKWTNNYEHTYKFEHAQHAQGFKDYIGPKWVLQP